MKYNILIRKGDAIAQRFPEKRAAWARFKNSSAADDVKLLSAMVNHLSEYQRSMTVQPTPESVKIFCDLHKN